MVAAPRAMAQALTLTPWKATAAQKLMGLPVEPPLESLVEVATLQASHKR